MERSKGWYIKQSYSNDFVDFLTELYKKYGESVFEIQGIANRHMDLVQFSKNFFEKSSNVADLSVDSNANVKEKNISQYNYENNKALMKLNSLYLLYKYVKKIFSLEDAQEVLEKVISGEIFINDLTNFSMPYSYYQETPIIVKINGKIKYLTMKQLFNLFSEHKEILNDRETIDLTNIYKDVSLNQVGFKLNGRKLKTFKQDVFLQNVEEKQNIKILDQNMQWVSLTAVLRHKNDRDLIFYQTENGNFSLVTDNHPIIAESGAQIVAHNLNIGDKIKEEKINFKFKESINVPEDLAYIVGFLLGDGSISRHKFYNSKFEQDDTCINISRQSNKISIYQKNIEETKIFCKLEKFFPKLRFNIRRNRDMLYFSSLKLNLLLKEYFDLNEIDNSFLKKLPSNILNWKKESKVALISGLIDSSGTTNHSRIVDIRMKAYALITQLSEVLTSIGIESHKRLCNNENFNFLFSISFNPTIDFANYSEKVKHKITNFNVKTKMASILRSNKVCKIFKIDSKSKINNYGNNVLEYVYDITTETNTFYSCGMIQHNCYAFDLRNLITKGMDFFSGNMNIGPPKRSDSFIALIIQATAYISNQIMGAASYPDFFVILDWYYRKELGEDYTDVIRIGKNNKDSEEYKVWKKIKNQFQNFIYSMNFPFRGSQSLVYNEEININGKTIAIGEYVNSNLKTNELEADISNSDITYSFNKDTGIFEEKKIKGVIKHELKNSIITLTTALGQEIECTDSHSLFTLDKTNIIEAEAKDLENVLVPFNFAKEKKINRFNVKNYGGKLKPCDIIMVPEIMYMIGQYIGDGSISKSGTLKLLTYNEKLDKYLENIIGNYFTTTRRRGRLNINLGKNFGYSLIDEFGSGAKNKRIPRNYYNDENILYLIGGYIDADGSYRENRGDIKITSINKKLLEDVQFILLANGIVSTLTYRHKLTNFGENNFYRLTIANEFAIKLADYIFLKKPIEKKDKPNYQRLKVCFDGFYNELDKKYNIYGIASQLNILNKSKLTIEDLKNIKIKIKECILKKDYYKIGSKNRELLKNDDRLIQLKECLETISKFDQLLPIRVVDISYSDDVHKYAYDISVEDNENFLTASNIYAHNSSFTNISVMDRGFMKSLFNDYIYPDFTRPNVDSVIELSKLFFEYYTDINSVEGMFTFPIMTIAISVDKDRNYIDPKFVDWAAEINSKKALANIFQDKPTSFSSCCRLKNDFSKVADVGYHNSFGVGGLSIGSHRVAGLNLPRLAILERDDSDIIEKDLEILHKILYSHRRLLIDRIKGGFLPLYSTDWIHLSRQYSTIGFIGSYEYIKNRGLDIKTDKGQKVLLNVLQKIENKIVEWQKFYNNEDKEIVIINNKEYKSFESIYIKNKKTEEIKYINVIDFTENYKEEEYLIDQ